MGIARIKRNRSSKTVQGARLDGIIRAERSWTFRWLLVARNGSLMSPGKGSKKWRCDGGMWSLELEAGWLRDRGRGHERKCHLRIRCFTDTQFKFGTAATEAKQHILETPPSSRIGPGENVALLNAVIRPSYVASFPRWITVGCLFVWTENPNSRFNGGETSVPICCPYLWVIVIALSPAERLLSIMSL